VTDCINANHNTPLLETHCSYPESFPVERAVMELCDSDSFPNLYLSTFETQRRTVLKQIIESITKSCKEQQHKTKWCKQNHIGRFEGQRP